VDGDLTQPLQLETVAVDASGALLPVRDGDSILLQKPPQGGYVIYAGAAARNLMSCHATVTAYLIDAASGSALTNLDQRTADFTLPGGGFFFPAQTYSQTPNIPACPDALHVGVAGRSATLHVQVTDWQSRTATIETRVVVSCGGDARCTCLCGPNPSSC
jgi:hypothetical protein